MGSNFGKGHHLHLIDGSAFIFRAYHALPPLTRKSDGLPIGAVSGFCNMLQRYVDGNLGGDVFYDNGDPWQEMGELSTPDILGATIHELGHSLGLGHDTNPDANLFWIFTRTAGLGTGALHPSDIAGIQAIYGAGVGSVTPLPSVPEPGTALIAIATLALASIAGRRSHSVL